MTMSMLNRNEFIAAYCKYSLNVDLMTPGKIKNNYDFGITLHVLFYFKFSLMF